MHSKYSSISQVHQSVNSLIDRTYYEGNGSQTNSSWSDGLSLLWEFGCIFVLHDLSSGPDNSVNHISRDYDRGQSLPDQAITSSDKHFWGNSSIMLVLLIGLESGISCNIAISHAVTRSHHLWSLSSERFTNFVCIAPISQESFSERIGVFLTRLDLLDISLILSVLKIFNTISHHWLR